MIRETLECVPQVESHTGHHSKQSSFVDKRNHTNPVTIKQSPVFFVLSSSDYRNRGMGLVYREE